MEFGEDVVERIVTLGIGEGGVALGWAVGWSGRGTDVECSAGRGPLRTGWSGDVGCTAAVAALRQGVDMLLVQYVASAFTIAPPAA